MWQWIFDARYGVVNWLLTRLGGDFEGHSWLSEPLSFFFVATLIVVWMGVPFVAFTLYAGMTQISARGPGGGRHRRRRRRGTGSATSPGRP